jgi:hypothetical protein
MLIFSISSPDLIKISLLYGYRWNKGERRPKDRVTLTNNFSIYAYMPQNIYTGLC